MNCKKTLFIIVIIFGIMGMISASSSIFAAETLLVKLSEQPAVYLVENGVRHPFPLSAIFFSWYGSDFSKIKVVNAAELTSYPLGKNVKFSPGSLIKIQTNPKVYHVLDSDGTLEWIPDEATFNSRGFSFKNVRDVPDTFWTDYKEKIAQQQLPPQTTETGAATSTPIQTPLSISNIKFAHERDASGTRTILTFTTSLPATAEIDYAFFGGATSTVRLSKNTQFTATLPVGQASHHTYVIRVNDGTQSASQFGAFVSYTDVVIDSRSDLVQENGPLLKPDALVAAFTITNRSSAGRTLTQLIPVFITEPTITTKPSKTLQIVQLNTDASISKILYERTYSSNTAIINRTNLQKIALTEALAPGESKILGVVFKNFEGIAFDADNASKTFITELDAADFLGDTLVALPQQTLGTLTYTKANN